jgi:hypothetical protein
MKKTVIDLKNVAAWLCPAKMSPQRGDATEAVLLQIKLPKQ